MARSADERVSVFELEVPATMAFRDLVCNGLVAPLPGGGRTDERFALLTEIAERDLAVARLAEGHLDALAILAEAGVEAPPDAVLGVWAAGGGLNPFSAVRTRCGWSLTGRKSYASGASAVTHALVTARTADGPRLFLVEAAGGITTVEGTWHAVGMRGSDSPDVEIEAILPQEAAIGGVDWYLLRPGFWHGAIGVAACWLGGARAIARPLDHACSPHAFAHLGAVDAGLEGASTMVGCAARAIDADPLLCGEESELRARRVRAVVEAAATDVITRVGRALGAGPLCHDAAHAQRVADLTVYLRQSHAEADLERLGRLSLGAVG